MVLMIYPLGTVEMRKGWFASSRWYTVTPRIFARGLCVAVVWRWGFAAQLSGGKLRIYSLRVLTGAGVVSSIRETPDARG